MSCKILMSCLLLLQLWFLQKGLFKPIERLDEPKSVDSRDGTPTSGGLYIDGL
ncbi:hypothetical protein E1A91_A11G147500v1 [Gossypium mustelinum]|uniref:Uncharacterized protein n=1 Tax=Gossypium mustelinum TaxID=34275 RepID=A0A5D2X6R4_GOSMU|nr:hypothetical protein E1A91_A11G147500v1 [Gossypium mustelinum]